jgi:hypothetical protein
MDGSQVARPPGRLVEAFAIPRAGNLVRRPKIGRRDIADNGPASPVLAVLAPLPAAVRETLAPLTKAPLTSVTWPRKAALGA